MVKIVTLGAILCAAGAAIPAFAAPPLAPPVTRTPAPANLPAIPPAPAPAQDPPSGPHLPAAAPTSVAPAAAAGGSERSYAAALTAAAAPAGADPVLDKSLIATMSRLMAVGRCVDAQALARGNGRASLAAAAKRICAGG